MKNLLLSAVLILLSFAGYSTSRGIEIINRSECPIYIQLHGSEKCPSCEHQYTSNLIMISPMSTTLISNTMMLGGTFPTTHPAFINCATIYSGPRQCQPQERWMIGDPRCCTPDIMFWSMNENCERKCPCLRARWEPTQQGCQGIARLMITPC